jgi:O-antigen biosynthesis alpha-1,2-rhamnosyltransferase
MNIYIDCTSTYISGLNTGIQRVVRNIINYSILISPEFQIKIIPVRWNNRNFIKISKKLEYTIQEQKPKSGKQKIIRIGKTVIKIFPVFLKRRLRLLFGYISIYILSCKDWGCPKITMGEKDIFLFPDSNWTINSYFWEYLKKLKQKNVKTGFIVYDIIPVLEPNFCVSYLEENFNIWFKKIIETSDFIFTISETVKSDVILYMQEQKVDRNIPITSFMLGSDIDGKNKEGETRENIKKIFKNEKTYLFVSTIEPRKNHNYAIDAFEVLWKNKKEVSLCLIGRMGWKYEKLLERIKNHPMYSKHLFLLNDVTDTELDYCYKNTKGVIFTSFIEGYGLPIVEGLSYNKPVFVSDIPIHREVGKDFCYYADLKNPESLAKLIDKNEQGILPKIDMSKFKNITWKESTRELIKKILALKL